MGAAPPAAARHAPNAFFGLQDDVAYAAWRARVLEHVPHSPAALLVELRDARNPTSAERRALLERVARHNMAIYATAADSEELARAIPRRLGAVLGLHTLDSNFLADDDGVTPLAVAGSAEQRPRAEFIPYTDRPINWHTDGYYNPPERAVRAMLLHCVRRAETGGENRLLDHRLAYVRLRDADPEHVRALAAPDAMTIPARTEADGGEARPAQPGPVFSVDADGHLHMRYTARTRSIVWKDDAATRAAVTALEHLLAHEPAVLRSRLEPGMGLVCNNVLHDRSGFTDSPRHTRLLLRARFHERVADPH